MTAQHWQRIKSLFNDALRLPPQERDSFLQRECPDAPELQAEVRRLLDNDSRDTDLLRPGTRGAPGQSFAANDIAAGRFRIIRLLGRGGMSEVYEAEDTQLGERLALKVIRPEIASDPATLSRFRQEIHLARRITHPNVCRIFDLGINDGGDPGCGSVFLTMELLPGETLAARLRRTGALAESEALVLVRQMGAGLEAAHQCGIVHRDFKSSNVMLVPGRDGSCRAVITDFGLARGTNLDSGSKGLTASGDVFGTLDYMAPEQLEKGESSFRSDVYSFGLVLFEMVTGELPFAERTPVGAALGRVQDTAPSPCKLRPQLSRAWETAIVACLQRDPAQRPASAGEVVKLLESDRTPGARRRRAVWSGCVIALAVLIGGTLYLRNTIPAKPVEWKPVPLTSFAGMEFHPAWSPDGELVAFAWDGERQDNVDIYVKQVASGAVSRLTDDPAIDISPAWSPDGREIAFRRLRSETSEIILKSYLGGPERKLAEWPYQNARNLNALAPGRDLCFSHDGKWLITNSGSFPSEFTGLFAVSLETGEAIKLTSPAGKFAADGAPALSPDGRILVFARATTPFVSELYILAFSDPHHSGVPKQITFDNKYATNPAWTLDGRSIIFSSNRKAGEAARHLWRVRVPRLGGVAKPPEPEFLAGMGDYTNDPAISKDGRMAYMQESHDLNIWELRLPTKNGQSANGARLISSTRDDVLADYSPDGKKIAFGSNRSGQHEIWVSDREGLNPVKLTSFGGPLTTDPHWSPDSKEIVFSTRGGKSRTEIYVISAQGGTPRRLIHGPEYSNPNWSRDGKWIYFCSPKNGVRQIWKMPVGGGQAIQVTKGGGVFAQESPDRQYIYYSKGRELDSSVWRVPMEGGVEVRVLPVVNSRNFAVTDRGIYFMPGGGQRNGVMPMARETSGIRFYSFATRMVTLIFTTDKPAYRGLVVSPDGHALLYSQFDRQDSDLWLVENFH